MSTLADVAVEARGDVVIARVEGEIDRSNARGIAESLVEAVPNAALELVLDLSGTSYMDSSGIHLLFELDSRLRTRQQVLRAVVPEGASIRRLLSVVALDSTVPVHPTVEEALSEARGHAAPER